MSQTSHDLGRGLIQSGEQNSLTRVWIFSLDSGVVSHSAIEGSTFPSARERFCLHLCNLLVFPFGSVGVHREGDRCNVLHDGMAFSPSKYLFLKALGICR